MNMIPLKPIGLNNRLEQHVFARLASLIDQKNENRYLDMGLNKIDLNLSVNLRNQMIRVLVNSIKLLESKSISSSNKIDVLNQVNELIPFLIGLEIKEEKLGSKSNFFSLQISYLKRDQLILNFVGIHFVIINQEKVSSLFKNTVIEDSRKLIKDLEILDKEFSVISNKELSLSEKDEDSWSSEDYKDGNLSDKEDLKSSNKGHEVKLGAKKIESTGIIFKN